MEERRSNRTLWIILGTIVALLALCGCLVLLGAAYLVITDRQVDIDEGGVGIGRVTDRIERTFNVGADPTLEIDNFAGSITIRAGEPGVIHVVATRRAPGRSDLEDIDIRWDERDDGLGITTRLPVARRLSNRSVSLDIQVPADTVLVVDNGAGEVLIEGIRGELDVHTGAGDVRAVGGLAGGSIDTGAGTVRYEGAPLEDLRLQTGAGSIAIFLPPDANVDLDLSTGVGSVDVDDFEVIGDTSPRDVNGTIGAGGPTIEAHTGAGSIDVRALR
ncbi:MAG TPA: hypothetical protein VLC95_18785 [Anaerolineae bacterium]|nr:hypothetical protein [Anaerolineae bacterium]